MIQKGIIFDPDHMSARARTQAMDIIRDEKAPGVVSSHSWADITIYPRVLEAGGVVTPYAGGSKGFYETWAAYKAFADPRYIFGFGYGSDVNGFGAQGGPRTDAPVKVSYPFTGFGGTTDRPAGIRRAGLRHQRGRRRPLRPVPGLDRGPPPAGRRRDHRRHASRIRGVPPDVGADDRHRARRVP